MYGMIDIDVLSYLAKRCLEIGDCDELILDLITGKATTLLKFLEPSSLASQLIG